MQAFRFQPRVFERVWGGHALNRVYGRPVPDTEARYGESWEISDRPEADSIVAEGPLEGESLHQLWMTRREKIFGKGYESFDRFPLLCKILDAQENLSIQVHPDDKAAALLGGESKNEIWYIADSDRDSLIYAGLRDGVGVDDVRKGVEDNNLQTMLNRYHLQQSDSFYIPAGLIHGIGPGNIIYEIQENSDTTYRLYDWGRKGRELHVEESLKCIEGRTFDAAPRFASPGVLADTPFFRMEEIKVPSGEFVPLPDQNWFSIVVVLEGRIELPSGLCREGDFVLVPAQATNFHAVGDARVLTVSCPPRQ